MVLYSGLELAMFLFYRTYVFIIIDKTINKSPSSATTMKNFACPLLRF